MLYLTPVRLLVCACAVAQEARQVSSGYNGPVQVSQSFTPDSPDLRSVQWCSRFTTSGAILQIHPSCILPLASDPRFSARNAGRTESARTLVSAFMHYWSHAHR